MPIFDRKPRLRELEAELRAGRAQPSPTLLRTIAARVDHEGSRSGRASLRLAFAGGLTTVMLVAVAGLGGASYAASAAREAIVAVKKVVAPAGPRGPVVVRGLNAGGDQYRPGFGFGDPNHNHTGPPELRRAGGELAPPLRAYPTRDGRAAIVSTRVFIDEQAHLDISVIGPAGKRLLLSQKGSKAGGKLSGPQTKTIQYQLNVPRAIRLKLRIPLNLLEEGETYRIRVKATDPAGETSVLLIPFRA